MSRPTQVPASPLRLRIRGSHPLRRGVPSASASPSLRFCRSYNPGTGHKTAPVWALPVPLAATPGIVITFSSCAYLDVSVQRVRLRQPADDGIAPAGFPHSEIRGSQGICPSPRLFAACHVLPRLREPRHPPCALVRPVISLLQRHDCTSLPLPGRRATTVFALPLTFDIARCLSTRRSLCLLCVCSQLASLNLCPLRSSRTRVASPACQCPCTFCPSGRRLSSREGSHCGSPWQS